MRPVSLILSDTDRVIDRQATASLYGLDVNDLVSGLLQKLSDDGIITDTSALMEWVGELVGKAGIARVLQDLHVKFDVGEPKDVLLLKWFSYGDVDEYPQPHVWPDELAESLTGIAQQVATTPEKFPALQLMEVPLAVFMRYMSLFYGHELGRIGRLVRPGDGPGPPVAEIIEEFSLSELCELLNCQVPLRARPYDSTSEDEVVLSSGVLPTLLSRLAELAGAAYTGSSEQSREFSACLLAVLGKWHGDDRCTPKACTVTDVGDPQSPSRLTCHDEADGTVVLKGAPSSIACGDDVLVRAADEGEIWAPEPQIVPRGRVWEMPETVSRKKRTARMRVRDQVFISYSHLDDKWLKALQMHLEPYVLNTKIAVWDDTKMKAGEDWKEKIVQALVSAKVAVLLVTPEFLASKFINEYELPPLLEAARSKGVTILWVPVKSSSFKVTPIAAYQSAHSPAKPLAALSTAARADAFVKICELIQQEYQR